MRKATVPGLATLNSANSTTNRFIFFDCRINVHCFVYITTGTAQNSGHMPLAVCKTRMSAATVSQLN